MLILVAHHGTGKGRGGLAGVGHSGSRGVKDALAHLGIGLAGFAGNGLLAWLGAGLLLGGEILPGTLFIGGGVVGVIAVGAGLQFGFEVVAGDVLAQVAGLVVAGRLGGWGDFLNCHRLDQPRFSYLQGGYGLGLLDRDLLGHFRLLRRCRLGEQLGHRLYSDGRLPGCLLADGCRRHGLVDVFRQEHRLGQVSQAGKALLLCRLSGDGDRLGLVGGDQLFELGVEQRLIDLADCGVAQSGGIRQSWALEETQPFIFQLVKTGGILFLALLAAGQGVEEHGGECLLFHGGSVRYGRG